MKLFKLDQHTHTVQIETEALLLKPFKVIYDRDDSEDKKIATAELAYVFFFTDFKSNYTEIMEEEERKNAIVDELPALPKGWKPDKAVQKAIEFYKEQTNTVGMQLLNGAKIGAHKLDKYLRNIDLEERDTRSNKPIHNPEQIRSMIEKLPQTLRKLREAEKEVQLELTRKAEMSGSGEKAFLEDGIK